MKGEVYSMIDKSCRALISFVPHRAHHSLFQGLMGLGAH